jgi:putative oxidoreductase
MDDISYPAEGVAAGEERTPTSKVAFSAQTVDRHLAPYGIVLLRLAIGIDWIAHALLKTSRGMETHEALLARNGITPLLAWPTFSIEILGGLAIILGIYSRQWALLLLVFLGVVVWVKWPVGWVYSNTGGGWEYPLFWFFAQASFVLFGDGAFALKVAPLVPRIFRQRD